LDLLAEISLSDNPDKNSILDEIAAITSAGMVGNMSFALSLEKRLSLLQANRDHLVQLQGSINDYISPSFVVHKDFFTVHKEKIFVVS
jgi:D-3-phosphoglycerate dehydrogenase